MLNIVYESIVNRFLHLDEVISLLAYLYLLLSLSSNQFVRQQEKNCHQWRTDAAPTTLASTLALCRVCDLDFQSLACIRHGPHTSSEPRSKVRRF